METKHTKGPWNIREDIPYSVAGFTIYSGVGEENKTIVRLPFGWVIPQPKTEVYYENFANAKLIAAAPELLDACIEMYELLERAHKGSMLGKGIRKQALEAIKKATK